LAEFWRALDWKMFLFFLILGPFGIFYVDLGCHDHLVHFLFCKFFTALVSCPKKNLATLVLCTCEDKIVFVCCFLPTEMFRFLCNCQKTKPRRCMYVTLEFLDRLSSLISMPISKHDPANMKNYILRPVM
jgi:hypothetical protein